MDIEIIHRPSYSLAIAKLTPNERIRAEAGAMVSMSGDVQIETKAEGGILKSLGRAVLGGEDGDRAAFSQKGIGDIAGQGEGDLGEPWVQRRQVDRGQICQRTTAVGDRLTGSVEQALALQAPYPSQLMTVG